MENGCVFCPNRWSWQLDFEESRPSETFRVCLASTGRRRRPRLGFKVIRRRLLRKYSAEWIERISERWKILLPLNPLSSDVCEQSRYSRSVSLTSSLMAAGCVRLLCPIAAAVSALFPPGKHRKASAAAFDADPVGAQAESDARSGRFCGLDAKRDAAFANICEWALLRAESARKSQFQHRGVKNSCLKEDAAAVWGFSPLLYGETVMSEQ